MSDNLYEWIHDDITWCGNECSYTECERNIQNRLTKGGYFSAAMFKGTDTCPLYESKDEPVNNEFSPTWNQGKSYCGYCGKRIPKKIKARYCPKCGKKIKWNKKGDT